MFQSLKNSSNNEAENTNNWKINKNTTMEQENIEREREETCDLNEPSFA